MTQANELRFSVVIPAYNAAKTIMAAIDSCLQQTYPPYEIIVVNDASEDDTAAIVESYGDRVTLITLTKNFGSAVARNKAWDRATGDYIAFLDADDIWHPEKLRVVNSVLSAKPDISFLFHNYALSDIKSYSLPENMTIYRYPYVKLLTSNPIATPCAVIRRNIDLRFESDMRYMEDYDLWLRAAYKYKAYFINLPLTQLGRPVLSQGGISSSKWKMRKGELKAYTRLLKTNPLFILLLPALYTFSIAKHAVKMVKG